MENERVEARKLGNYMLEDQISFGSFSDIYLATDSNLDVIVIKVLRTRDRAASDEDYLEKLRQIKSEEFHTRNLRHPNIASVISAGEWNGHYYTVSELIEGKQVAKAYPLGQVLDSKTVISFVSQLGSAIQYCHDNGIVHRDLKPNNLLILVDGTIKITDFGLSIDIGHGESDSYMDGPAHYISPEQRLGKATYASDQYSLAVNTYVWLTGRYPFEASNRDELMDMHIFMDPPAMYRLQDETDLVPENVSEVVLKGMGKDPDDRYESVQNFTDALVRELSKI